MVSKMVNSEGFQSAIKWGHLLSLLGALGIVVGYGSQFGRISRTVEFNTETLKKHDAILSVGDRWTKQDHQEYASSTDRRIGAIEGRMDTYMMEIRNRMDKIYERLSRIN